MTNNTPEHLYKFIGRKICARRKEFKLTQDRLAEEIGMRRTSIANIEAGRQAPPVDTIYAIARALDCNPKEFLPEPNTDWSEHKDLLLNEIEIMAKDLDPESLKVLLARLKKKA